MPIISENPKALYVHLYKELTNKNSPLRLYFTGGLGFTEKDNAVGTAIKRFIRKFEDNKEQMLAEEPVSATVNGVGYQDDISYKFAKETMEWDEELCNELEEDVQAIRAALFDSVAYKLKDTETYDEILELKDTDVYTNEQKLNAQKKKMLDAFGKLENNELDEKIDNEKRTNLEYNHRPVIYEAESNPDTGEVTYKKAERYVSFKEMESKEYKFFEMKSIQYSSDLNADAYGVAPVLLRDILQNHKQMKEEGDRRREYVKFINGQHQSYAVWKEQIVKEVDRYKKLLSNCSKATLDRYNQAMEQYNSTDSMLSGTREWFINEHKDYVARKMALAEKELERDNAAGEIESLAIGYDEFTKKIKQDREDAAKDLDEFRKKPELDEETMKKDQADLEDRLTQIAALKEEIHGLETDFTEHVEQQEKSRQMLLSVKEKVDEYKQHIENLKNHASKENFDAVSKFQEIMINSEIQIGKEMKEFNQDIIKYAKERQKILDAQTKINEDMQNITDEFHKVMGEHKECERDFANIQNFLTANGKAEKKNLNEFKKYMKEKKEHCAKMQMADENTLDVLMQAADVFAIQKGWNLNGTMAIFLDEEFFKDMKKENEHRKERAEKMIHKLEEERQKFEEKTLELLPMGQKIDELTQYAIDSLDEYSKMLENIQSYSDKEKQDTLADMNRATDEKSREGEQAIKEQEEALLKNHQELEKALQDKAKNLNEKKALLDQLMNEQEVLGVRVEKANELKKELEDKQAAFVTLCLQQDKDLKDIEEKKEAAVKLWEEKQKEYEDEKELSEDFIKDYEYLEEQYTNDDMISARKLDDMKTFTNNQASKLAADAEKQREYIREKQAERCMVIRSELKELRESLFNVEKPKGFLKVKNSREFSMFRNEVSKYMDVYVKVPDANNPGDFEEILNPDQITSPLYWLSHQNDYVKDDKARMDYMKSVCEAMNNISKAADVYLKAKGDPLRSTDLGNKRYITASMISTQAKRIKFEMEGMMREEQLCLDAPNLGLVSQKSGVNDPDYTKTEGFKYVGNTLRREGDSTYTDRMMRLDDAIARTNRILEEENKQNQQKQEPKAPVKEEPAGPNV